MEKHLKVFLLNVATPPQLAVERMTAEVVGQSKTRLEWQKHANGYYGQIKIKRNVQQPVNSDPTLFLRSSSGL